MLLGQPYPHRPIKLVVPLPPGGGSDPVARIVGEKVAVALGQPVALESALGNLTAGWGIEVSPSAGSG